MIRIGIPGRKSIVKFNSEKLAVIELSILTPNKKLLLVISTV